MVIDEAKSRLFKKEHKEIFIKSKVYSALSKIFNIDYNPLITTEYDIKFGYSIKTPNSIIYDDIKYNEYWEKSILKKFFIVIHNRRDILESQDLRDVYGYDNLINTPTIQIKLDKIETIYRFDRIDDEKDVSIHFAKKLLINNNIPLNPH